MTRIIYKQICFSLLSLNFSDSPHSVHTQLSPSHYGASPADQGQLQTLCERLSSAGRPVLRSEASPQAQEACTPVVFWCGLGFSVSRISRSQRGTWSVSFSCMPTVRGDLWFCSLRFLDTDAPQMSLKVLDEESDSLPRFLVVTQLWEGAGIVSPSVSFTLSCCFDPKIRLAPEYLWPCTHQAKTRRLFGTGRGHSRAGPASSC